MSSEVSLDFQVSALLSLEKDLLSYTTLELISSILICGKWHLIPEVRVRSKHTEVYDMLGTGPHAWCGLHEQSS